MHAPLQVGIRLGQTLVPAASHQIYVLEGVRTVVARRSKDLEVWRVDERRMYSCHLYRGKDDCRYDQAQMQCLFREDLDESVR